ALGAALLLLPRIQTWFYTVGFRWLYVLLVSYLVATALTPLIRHLAVRIGAVDHPASRQIHESSTPLLGGVAVYLAFLIAILANTAGLAAPLVLNEGMLGVLAGGTLLLLIGVRDDIRPVPATVKLVVQIVAAAIVIWAGKLLTFFPHSVWGDALNVLLPVVCIVGITNPFIFYYGIE